MNITLLVANLERGGAERQAVLLAGGLAAAGHRVTVAAFRAGGPFAAELVERRVPVVGLAGGSAYWPAEVLARLAGHLARSQCEVLYSLLPAANIAAGLMRFARPRCRIVWGIRSANMPLHHYSLKTQAAYALERRLCRLSNVIIANSQAGLSESLRKGFPKDKLHFVPNGFDIRRFSADAKKRALRRAAWGITDKHVAIGLAARLDPVKDHATFIGAAAMLAARHRDVRFVAIGDGPAAYRGLLMRMATTAGISDRMVWTGAEQDMPAAYSALDIATLTSTAEGFPNAVGEAMACGIVCVATDVGDTAFLIGDTGFVVPPRQPASVAEGWERLLDPVVRQQRGAQARARIVSRFDVDALVACSLAVFRGYK